jgi:hypothetical protein
MVGSQLTDIHRLYQMICQDRPGRLRLQRKSAITREFIKYRNVHPAQRLILHVQMAPGITRQSTKALLRHVLALFKEDGLTPPDAEVILANTSIVIQTGRTVLSMLSNAKAKSKEYVAGQIRE